MKLENQVTSLELSKRLKELGVKQESLFYYQGRQEELDKGFGFLLDKGKILTWEGAAFLSAFTVAELGEMLPANVASQRKDVTRPDGKVIKDAWVAILATKKTEDAYFTDADTEANARAKMLIYLTE